MRGIARLLFVSTIKIRGLHIFHKFLKFVTISNGLLILAYELTPNLHVMILCNSMNYIGNYNYIALSRFRAEQIEAVPPQAVQLVTPMTDLTSQLRYTRFYRPTVVPN